MRLLLIGCTGFIGKGLLPNLIKEGHEITLVSRKKKPELLNRFQDGCIHIELDPSLDQSWSKASLINALEEAEGVINLAGEPIADKRWTENHLKLIRNSRLNTTKNLINAISSSKKRPKVLINGSAIGFYGTSLEKNFDENSIAGKDFLAKLCQDWEYLAKEKPQATRLVTLRIGIVLEKDGGALGKMLPIFKSGFGGPLGNGNQWMSWIHRDDLCNIIKESLSNRNWKGTFNCVAPEPVSMKVFSNTLGDCLRKPSLLPVPGILLELLLGDGAKVVLEGQRVCPKKLIKLGFNYKHNNIKSALIDITKSNNN